MCGVEIFYDISGRPVVFVDGAIHRFSCHTTVEREVEVPGHYGEDVLITVVEMADVYVSEEGHIYYDYVLDRN